MLLGEFGVQELAGTSSRFELGVLKYPKRSKAAFPPPRRANILNFGGPERENIKF